MTNQNACRKCRATFQSEFCRHECDSCEAEIMAALETVLDSLEWVNAHTITALLEWHYKGTKTPEQAAKCELAYEAARQALAGEFNFSELANIKG